VTAASAAQLRTLPDATGRKFAWLPNKRKKLMRRRSSVHWSRSAHSLCAVRWAEPSRSISVTR